ncbi:MAG TPA: Mur ligase domain-containing protein [Candidatus Saccharibacteria bacterium]|nr:Mur ligase domain-containing protein [Candidatus Saccharibacteria bacterium]HMR38489.1 Mur ligase domain-containing protein [Candidatus Saccharibacteria bacterium]
MKIYFSGIGGVAIGPLAQAAQDAGHEVYGSDVSPSLVTKRLEARGISIYFDQSGDQLEMEHARAPIDWFVYTAALPLDHPELQMASQLGITISKRDGLIAHIIKESGQKLIAIAGTHGKTTTTGMMIWVIQQLGLPISYLVGTTLSFGSSGMFSPDSQYFIYECDEFDKNFLHFHPYISLITAIDYDHPDTYPTEAEYLTAFQQFTHQSHQTIAWQKDIATLASPRQNAHFTEINTIVNDLQLAGLHNRQNATLVLAALEQLQLGESVKNLQIINQFPGTDRRFEKLADNLYSDYGHHPAEIAATLQMAKEISQQVALVYQPHQNIRQHEIRDQYTDCMLSADTIYWLPTYLTREDPNLPILTPSELSAHLVNRQAVHFAELNDELWQNITTLRQNGALVLLMGAGTIDSWARQQLTD